MVTEVVSLKRLKQKTMYIKTNYTITPLKNKAIHPL